MPAAPQRRYAVQAHTGAGCDLRNPQQTLIENYLIGVCGGFFPRTTMRAEFKPPFRMRANLLGLVVATLIPALSFMCVCAQRTGTSLPLYGTSAADCTATGAASPVRPRLALGAWASNPFWPMGRRALRAKRGASAKETAEACRSGGPRTGTKPSARGALDEPSTRNTIRQPPRGRQIVTGGRRQTW